MEAETLKKALVNFLAEVVIETRARVGSAMDDHLKTLLERERAILEREKAFTLKPVPVTGPKSRYLSVNQAGEYMGMTGKAFRVMLSRHPVPKGIVVRLGRKLFVDMPAFEKWISSQP